MRLSLTPIIRRRRVPTVFGGPHPPLLCYKESLGQAERSREIPGCILLDGFIGMSGFNWREFSPAEHLYDEGVERVNPCRSARDCRPLPLYSPLRRWGSPQPIVNDG